MVKICFEGVVMVIKRDKDYNIYLVVYVITFVCLFCLYRFGFDTSVGFAFLINTPVYIIAIAGLISTGRTFIMDEEGCTVVFWKYRKKYMWEELKTRRIEEHTFPSMHRGRVGYPYLKGAIFAPYKIHKPRIIRANLYSLFHPFSCIYINCSIPNTNYQIGRYYEVEETTFCQKMNDWGVTLEEIPKLFS